MPIDFTLTVCGHATGFVCVGSMLDLCGMLLDCRIAFCEIYVGCMQDYCGVHVCVSV